MEEILKGSPLDFDITLTPNAEVSKWSDYKNVVVWVFSDKQNIAKCSITEKTGYGTISVQSNTVIKVEVEGAKTRDMASGALWFEIYNDHEDKMLCAPGRVSLGLKLVDCAIKDEIT